MRAAFCVMAMNPCQWYRLLEPARVFPDAELLFPGAWDRAAASDVAQFNYVHSAAEIEIIKSLRAQGVAIALDYDDAVMQMHGAPVGVIAEALSLADVVTISTRRLIPGFANSIHGVRWAVVPNRIDTIEWTPQVVRTGESCTIAYSGSSTHTWDLTYVSEVLWHVLRARPAARLRVLGCDNTYIPPELRERVEQRKWVSVPDHREAIIALDADIAIAPLRPTPVNQGRSALKWMQFAALGIPMVVSRCPAYCDAVVHGETGMLASCAEEWLKALLYLIDNPRARGMMGAKARHDAVLNHNLGRDVDTRQTAYQIAIARAKQRS